MNGTTVKEYLELLGEHLEKGRSLGPLRQVMVRRFLTPVAVPAAIGLGLALGLSPMGCNEEETNCRDGLDNDDDGAVDCDDSDCYDAVACEAVDAYGVPFPETDCGDDVDNDGDGAVDCIDTDCADDDLCVADLYGTPFL